MRNNGKPNKNKFLKPEKQYIRVGCHYYKIIQAVDKSGIQRTELILWKKEEIKTDYGQVVIDNMSKYDKFIVEPNNRNFQQVIDNCYNQYKPFSHKSQAGETYWTEILLKHVFGEQYKIGLMYLQILYLYPTKMLPVLVLVSKERQTGKTTFLNWLQVLFGENFVLITQQDFTGSFNEIYLTANIIGIDEAVVDKQTVMNKIKTLSTHGTVVVNDKYVRKYNIPFYGKFILTSNNEDNFIKIDQDEIRFFIRKLSTPKIENHNIENDLIKEIPGFLKMLEEMPIPDFTKSRQVFTVEELDNEFLQTVKKESMPELYKELKEYFSDFFNEHESCKSFYANPTRIKKEYFKNNNQISTSYIKRILKEYFEFKQVEKNGRYQYFNDMDTSNGLPFIILREKVLNESEIKNIEDNNKTTESNDNQDNNEPF